MTAPNYVIVTPVRNEAERVGKTIASVAAQTLRPRKWIIVNDGSTDATTEILQAAEQKHPWIQTVHRADRGCRQPGGGVIEAFYDGYRLLAAAVAAPNDQPAPADWDYLVKLDGDLEFERTYFEKCFERFQADQKLGIAGGTICCSIQGQWVEEAKGDPPFHVRGATKIYRRACWEALGGLIKAPGWDTLDEVKANMLGWRTYSFKDIKLLQLKDTGVADGTWRNWFKNGRANYIVGYHPVFMLSKCASRLFRRPYVIAAGGLLCGFFSGYLQRVPQIEDSALIQYLRQQQWRRLTARPSLWSVHTP